MSFHVLRFNRAASRYEPEAGIQLRMAGKLLELWKGPVPGSILELGCGTGLLTRRLCERFPSASILATDAAQAMLVEARKRCGDGGGGRLVFTELDARGNVPAAKEVISASPFNTVCSNALVQWFPNLETHLRFVSKLSAADGAYLLSGFTQSNFPELNELLSEPPFSYRDFPGHDSEEVEQAAGNAGWKVSVLYTWEEKEILPSAREVLRRIQTLGSSRDPHSGGRLNRKNLEWLISEYSRRFSEGGGVRLTWKPWIALLRR